MRQYSIEDARKQLGDLVADVRRTGQPIAITSYRKPAARLVPMEPTMTLAEIASAVDAYDIVEIADDNTDYEPGDVGRIAVQRDGQLVAWADDLDDAVSRIGREVGVKVCASPAGSYFSGRRWTVA